MFGFFNRNKIRLQIVFNQAVAGHVIHGTAWCDNKTLGFKNHPVAFAFVGVDTAPKLDRALFNFICDKFEAAGYTVHGLRSYEGLFKAQGERVPMQAVKDMIQATPNKIALDIHYAIERAKKRGESQIIACGKIMVHPDGSVQHAVEGSKFTDVHSGGAVVVGVHDLGGPSGMQTAYIPTTEDEVMDMSGMLGVRA